MAKNHVLIVLGCLLSICNLFVQSVPLKYPGENSNKNGNAESTLAHPASSGKDPQTNQAAQKPPEYAIDAGQGPMAPENTVGLRMFPQLFEDGNTGQMMPSGRSQDRVHLFSNQGRVRLFPQKDNAEPAGKNSDVGQARTEMTVSLPKLVTDSNGNVVDKWGATTGDSSDDTRFKQYYRGPPPTPQYRAKPNNLDFRAKFYMPANYSDLTTVCYKRSTPYNKPYVYNWLAPLTYKFPERRTRYLPRIIWLDLRRELYKDGNPLECHTPKMTDWNEYIHCAMLRNMRSEYLVPKYPLTQVGSYSYATNVWFGN